MKDRKDLPAYLFFKFIFYLKKALLTPICYNLNNYKKAKSKDLAFLKLDTLLFKSNMSVKLINLVIKRFSSPHFPVGVFLGVSNLTPPFAINQLSHFLLFAC